MGVGREENSTTIRRYLGSEAKQQLQCKTVQHVKRPSGATESQTLQALHDSEGRHGPLS
jgi:hypothetical protein